VLSFVAACSSDGDAAKHNGGFQITVSGEALATTGYAFHANATTNDDPPPFVDGWEVRFEHVIVTVGNIHLNATPDLDPADPTNLGPEVARVPGIFAVDATIGGNIVGKSGEADEKTVAIADVTGDFDPAARYAFGYDTLAASADAKLVNLDDAGKVLYEKAKANHWAMVYAGTATYAGPPPDGVFASLPKSVHFELGFANPASYVNCQNTDLVAIGDEFPRGVQASVDKPTTVQITIHTDHAFWSKLNVEGTELHFDPVAAAAKNGVVTTADLDGENIAAFPIDGRSYVSGYTPPPGKLSFDANGTSFSKPLSFASYMAYSAASGGHMNADGECTIRDNFTP
jgi:hypothetical protein